MRNSKLEKAMKNLGWRFDVIDSSSWGVWILYIQFLLYAQQQQNNDDYDDALCRKQRTVDY